MDRSFLIDVKVCARCGGEHRNLMFRSLSNPADDWVFWGTCPVLREPVLLKMEQIDESDDDAA